MTSSESTEDNATGIGIEGVEGPTSPSPPTPPDPPYSARFWWETARQFVLTIVGVVLIVGPIQRYLDNKARIEADKESALIRARLDMRRTVVDDFIRISSKYTATAADVLSKKDDALSPEDRHAWDDDKKQWEGELVDKYRGDMALLVLYFGKTVAADIATIRFESDTLHRALKDGSIDWAERRASLKADNLRTARNALRIVGLSPDDITTL